MIRRRRIMRNPTFFVRGRCPHLPGQTLIPLRQFLSEIYRAVNCRLSRHIFYHCNNIHFDINFGKNEIKSIRNRMSEKISAISIYLAAIKKNIADGNSTEHTHRPALKILLETIGKGITATNEPTRIKCGSPDFQITRKGVPLGHIETKDIGTNLDEMERKKGPHAEQFARYHDALPNWILTDYLQFRWFVAGEKRLTVSVAELDNKGKLKFLPEGAEKLEQLFTAFYKQKALTVGTAKDLAQRMAGMTRILCDLIVNAFDHEEKHDWLHNWLAAFRETLIPDINEKQFADMFAQTLAYGLFAARVHTPANKIFSREMAAYNLPKTNPFLRKLFAEIAGVNMPDSFDWAANDIVELLKHADMSAILKDFGKGKGKEDPVVHFYETFLAAYDPKIRDIRGVYYTPEPVVSYIVRSIDYLLKTRFNRPKGLADENTLILDPATGTATFLYFVIDLIHNKFAKQAGAWDDYVAKHLLNRIFGFELLIAPYAIAHLKLGMQLKETGYKFESDQRLGIFLTNTLEEAAAKSERILTNWIADEANAAAEIKKEKPIVVVTGNPPYSPSMCEGAWIMSLIADYKKDLKEKKTDLNREEWKFLRFAQWRIDQTGEGIVAFIINNSFLDAITHRKMRKLILESFHEVYILNLGGSVKGRDSMREDGIDKNVFDIKQGVTIAIFVKCRDYDGTPVVYHAELRGLREAKYEFLAANEVSTTKWTTLAPSPEEYFFVPRNEKSRGEYENGFKITEIFPTYSSGIQTKRDSLCIHLTRQKLWQTLQEFDRLPPEEARKKFELGDDGRDWLVVNAKADVHVSGPSERWITGILYRPFDFRFTYWTGKTRGFLAYPRRDVMQHIVNRSNIGMLVNRQIVGEHVSHFGVSRLPTCHGTFYLGNKGQDYFLPLYLYQDEGLITADRWPNFSPKFLKTLSEKLKLAQTQPYRMPKGVTPEDIFHYAYAVFHSPTYRKRYAEFLKIDFPRLPITSNIKLFRTLASKGAELVSLHLMESPKLEELITEWPIKGDSIVEKVHYAEKDKRVWVNKTQYFSGVPKAVWEFQVGGYQVCEKWLKDRKGRKLSYDDIMHYQKIVVALKETIRLMAEIDKCIPRWPID
jgi:predicted helicase